MKEARAAPSWLRVNGNGIPLRHGFTLTELLVVIGIIAIALAIVLTIFHSAIKAVRALKG